jgi:hypothetical protein
MTKSRRKAIRIIEECNASHVGWAAWLKLHPKDKKAQIAGDRKFHRKWVRKYNFVLRVLRG